MEIRIAGVSTAIEEVERLEVISLDSLVFGKGRTEVGGETSGDRDVVAGVESLSSVTWCFGGMGLRGKVICQ